MEVLFVKGETRVMYTLNHNLFLSGRKWMHTFPEWHSRQHFKNLPRKGFQGHSYIRILRDENAGNCSGFNALRRLARRKLIGFFHACSGQVELMSMAAPHYSDSESNTKAWRSAFKSPSAARLAIPHRSVGLGSKAPEFLGKKPGLRCFIHGFLLSLTLVRLTILSGSTRSFPSIGTV